MNLIPGYSHEPQVLQGNTCSWACFVRYLCQSPKMKLERRSLWLRFNFPPNKCGKDMRQVQEMPA